MTNPLLKLVAHGRIELQVDGRLVTWEGPVSMVEQKQPAIETAPEDGDWMAYKPGPDLTVALTFDVDQLKRTGVKP